MTNSDSTLSEPLSEPPAVRRPSWATKATLATIRAYQRLTSGRPSPCRFYPSCSNYAVEAVEVHGALRGGSLALRRLSKCRPLGPHGIDLVPAPRSSHRKGKN